MYDKGWNKSVLPEYTYYLGENKFTLPQVPPVQAWSQFCTCQNTKSELLTCASTTTNETMTQHFTETCPINLFHCEVNRQAGARINLNPEMAKKFRLFSSWASTAYAKRMK